MAPMTDAETLSFTLTYLGTLTVGALMLMGQLAACTILLALAGLIRLIALPISALSRRVKSSPQVDRSTNVSRG